MEDFEPSIRVKGTAVIERVEVTENARALVEKLREQHGQIYFYLSHGCCDGTAPVCLAPQEMSLNASDVQLGTVCGAEFWLSPEQVGHMEGMHVTLDVAVGENGNFSLEEGSGQRFILTTQSIPSGEKAEI